MRRFYKARFVHDDTTKSPLSPILSFQTVLTETGEEDEISIPTGPDTTVARELYQANKNGDYLFVARLEDNTTTNYTRKVS